VFDRKSIPPENFHRDFRVPEVKWDTFDAGQDEEVAVEWRV
jgi:hypothetical protein